MNCKTAASLLLVSQVSALQLASEKRLPGPEVNGLLNWRRWSPEARQISDLQQQSIKVNQLIDAQERATGGL